MKLITYKNFISIFLTVFFMVYLLGCITKEDQKVISQSYNVGWAPTPSDIAEEGLKWISVGPGDIVYELGCGDGRVAIEAAKLGAEVVCIEIDEALYTTSKIAIEEAGFEDCIKVINKDLFTIDLSPATVIYIFLLPSMNEKLRPIFEASLRPGTRIISREFQIPGWPDGERLELPGFLFLKWVMP